MSIVYTPLYAAVLALMFVYLSLRVVGARRGGYGRPDHPEGWRLERAVRGHGNFAEYTPLALILVLLLELNSAPAWAVHAVAATFLVGRILHAAAFSTQHGMFMFRQLGTGSTFTALLLGAGLNVWVAVWG